MEENIFSAEKKPSESDSISNNKFENEKKENTVKPLV